MPGRVALDTPSAHAFSVGDEEFIAGTPYSVAEQAVAQCRDVGAGHFLAIFNRALAQDQIGRAWELFGMEVNPALRRA
jgi:hypothetical protein